MMGVRCYRQLAKRQHATMMTSARGFRSGVRPRLRVEPGRQLRQPPRRNFIAMPQGDAAYVIGGLMAANCGVWVAWQYVDPWFMQKHFLVSRRTVASYPHTLLTASFSHMDGYHLLGNMVTLFFFGPNVVGAVGAR